MNLTNKNKVSRLLLLDRDGVINQDSPNYIKSPDEFIFLSGSIDAIRLATKNGYRIGIATNQSGLSRGYFDKKELNAIHEKMLVQIRKAGGDIEAIEYCPHLPDEKCICRKPSPGMLHILARRLKCSLTGIPFIGDKMSDVLAALACGAMPMVVLSSMTDTLALKAYPDVPIFNSLKECIEHLLELS